MRSTDKTLAVGDRVMVVNRFSTFMGEAGQVVKRKGESSAYHVLLDGDDEGDLTFHISELEKLP